VGPEPLHPHVCGPHVAHELDIILLRLGGYAIFFFGAEKADAGPPQYINIFRCISRCPKISSEQKSAVFREKKREKNATGRAKVLPPPPRKIIPRLRGGWPSYYNAPAGRKKAEVRITPIFVRKLAVKSSVCGVSECAALPLQRVTTVVKLASSENIFVRAS
jgi:hypothetical protein